MSLVIEISINWPQTRSRIIYQKKFDPPDSVSVDPRSAVPPVLGLGMYNYDTDLVVLKVTLCPVPSRPGPFFSRMALHFLGGGGGAAQQRAGCQPAAFCPAPSTPHLPPYGMRGFHQESIGGGGGWVPPGAHFQPVAFLAAGGWTPPPAGPLRKAPPLAPDVRLGPQAGPRRPAHAPRRVHQWGLGAGGPEFYVFF